MTLQRAQEMAWDDGQLVGWSDGQIVGWETVSVIFFLDQLIGELMSLVIPATVSDFTADALPSGFSADAFPFYDALIQSDADFVVSQTDRMPNANVHNLVVSAGPVDRTDYPALVFSCDEGDLSPNSSSSMGAARYSLYYGAVEFTIFHASLAHGLIYADYLKECIGAGIARRIPSERISVQRMTETGRTREYAGDSDGVWTVTASYDIDYVLDRIAIN